MNYSVTQRYSVYGAIGSILFVVFIVWLLLVALAPKENTEPFETVVVKEPKEKPAPIDPLSDIRREARVNGLDFTLVLGVIKSENLLTPHKEIEGACRMKNDRSACIANLGKLHTELANFLSRKPTASDVLLAHSFGVNEAVRISRLVGVDKIDTLGEEILNANPNLKAFESIRAFRIWLGRSIYRRIY